MDEAQKEEIIRKKAAKGDMTEGNVAKKLIAFAIPVAIASLVQALYNLADMSIVGHFVGSAGMSAVTMGGLIINVVFAAFLGAVFSAFFFSYGILFFQQGLLSRVKIFIELPLYKGGRRYCDQHTN